jgi:hypothetical protein
MYCDGSVLTAESAIYFGIADLILPQQGTPRNISYNLASLELDETANDDCFGGCCGIIFTPSIWVVSECFGSAKLINVISIIINNRISLCFYKAR